MTRFKPIFLAAVSALLAAVTVDAARPHYGGTLRIETTDAAVMRRVNALAYETLVASDTPGTLRPVLAISWQGDGSGRRWTFRLRRGVTLHDGSTLQPSQVAEALRMAHADWQITSGADTVAIDAGRDAPDFPFELADQGNAIVVRPAGGALTGSGPFRVERVDAGVITLRAHEGYWDSRPFVDAIEVRTTRSPADQLLDLEAARADMVGIQPTDVRRMEQRQFRIEASRPNEVFVLAFEAHVATATSESVRRTLAGSIDRGAIARVVLQGRAEAADALLPQWLSGHAPIVPGRGAEPLARSAVAALPADRRTLGLRVAASDPAAQAIAQRIAVNARDAGFTITVQSPPGLGPRFDVRLLRVPMRGATPGAALSDVMAGLGARTVALAGRVTPPEPGAPIDTVLFTEHALVEHHVLVPIVHVPELYAVSPRFESWNGPAVLPSGAWNLANAWLRRAMSLRNRLFALVSGVVVLTVVLVTWTVSSSARQSFATVDTQRSAALVTQFRREFANQGEQVSLRLDRIAQSDAASRVAAGIAAARDFAPFVNEATPLAAAQELDVLDLVAADGTIVSSAEWPARFGYQHAWARKAVHAINPSSGFLQPVEFPDETGLGLVAVRTLPAGSGTLYLAGGRRLDRKFLQSLVLPPGMRVLLYENLQPEVSGRQLIAAEDDPPEAAPLEPLIARVIQDRREAREVIEWPEGPETVDALPLGGPDGGVLGVLLVGSSGRELAALVRRIRWSGVGFGAVAIGVGFLLSFLVSARVTRPVEQLAGAARAVADGDWDVHVDDLRTTGEIKVLAEAFETMTRQLVDHRDRLVQAERVAAWRELARRLAHELKNPLFPLRITIDNLRRAKSLSPAEFDEVFDESLTTLQTGLGNLNAVIGRFSDFARMPAPEFSQVSINELVEQAVALFRAQLAAPGQPPVDVALELDAAVGTIRADGEQLRRVVQNLLLNAIDAMPEGGELRITTVRSGDVVRIDVADTGQGLGEEERSRLFTPYYTTRQHGTGLGLAIVQSVVTDHRGKIWVDSEPGRGATFHIELPA